MGGTFWGKSFQCTELCLNSLGVGVHFPQMGGGITAEGFHPEGAE